MLKIMIFVALLKGTINRILSYYEEYSQVAYLATFAVKSSRKRNNIGQKLVEILRQVLESKGYNGTRGVAREEGVLLYKKCKFEIVSDPVMNASLEMIDFKMVCRI
ncbi:GNAT family N-acetyltransferase [Vagococcus sp. BWB3-3]|uniref:GNAT family N-acetyltransferase n=1 Tax=Vagococcus allomyrinae TaxID=2794353 RepID=A0A940PDP8_9ENTE|nr:GNAT family N-acetyltransferase [Vagococcus allomyrinae]